MTAIVVETTHRAEQELGPPITADGEVRWLSASAVVKFDPNTEGGCPMRGWFHYVGSQLGISVREPETAAMSAGTGMHKEIEDHLKTGAMTLGPIAMGGREFIPAPGAGLSVEWPVILHPEHEHRADILLAADRQPEFVPWDGFTKPAGVWLRIAGVPYAGHLDLYNHRGEYINAQGDMRRDPPNTLECKDWKSTSDLAWAKNPEQVANAIPMTGYAMAGFEIWPHYERARMTHVYFQRKAPHPAKLSTALRERTQIEKRWEYANAIARSIIDIAREEDPLKVPVNVKACESYRQLCPNFAACPRGRAAKSKTSLEAMMGPRLSALVSGNIRAALGQTPVPEDTIDIFADLQENDMGLLKNVGAKNPITQNTPAAPAASVSIDDLLEEEDAARDEAAADERKPLHGSPPTEEFKRSWEIIGASGLGTPRLYGLCANMLLTWRGEPAYTDSRIEGDGKLAKLDEITDPIKLAELARQIAAKQAKAKAPAAPPPIPATAERVTRTDPAPQPAIELLPADAPQSSPAIAADPVEGLDNAKTRELAAARAPSPAAALAKAAGTGPEPQDLIAADAASPEAKAAAAAPAKAPKPKADKPKAEPKVIASGGPSADPAPAKPAAPAKVTGFSLYIDVAVEGIETKRLDDYVTIVAGELCATWGCTDVRLADNTTEGGYGKGPVVLAALCAKNPPPAGVYVVDTRGNPLVEAAAVALRAACLASGGVYVRGNR